jgi:hypothetical protein
MNPFLEELKKLSEKWRKDGLAHAKLFPTPEGSRPNELTAAQLSAGCVCSSLRVCAHELEQAVSKEEKRLKL